MSISLIKMLKPRICQQIWLFMRSSMILWTILSMKILQKSPLLKHIFLNWRIHIRIWLLKVCFHFHSIRCCGVAWCHWVNFLMIVSLSFCTFTPVDIHTDFMLFCINDYPSGPLIKFASSTCKKDHSHGVDMVTESISKQWHFIWIIFPQKLVFMSF